ncbi:MAG TPA: trehalose-6-phosphate synthase, partial [Candidatus Goldiibacteriota bacterium]|nr:trehalose-6-phosphate synthase [Candidatus Goldiibacteriota bacterium]
DYTKGIVERITALNRFFEKYPEQKGRFTFIQIGAPSRTNIKKYNELINEIDAEVDKINLAYGTENWKPFIYIKKHLSYSEILPFYTMADLCIVSSLHDGMNLVAKEFVSAKKDNDGVLILSSFAGASRELEEALIINPYSAEEFADAIYSGLEMDIDERKRRMESMREVVGEGNVYKWAGSIIDEIALITGKNQ